MGVHVVKMPDIGEGIAEVEIVAWHVAPGDSVSEDQVVAEVMTDKASVEIPSPVAGRIGALGGKAGDVLAVGAELLSIEIDGKDDEGAQAPSSAAPSAASSSSVLQTNPSPSIESGASTAPSGVVVANADADAERTGGLTRRAARDQSGRPLASPSVRQRAWDHGIDLRLVRASGNAGVIVHADLDAWLASEVQGGGITNEAPATRRTDAIRAEVTRSNVALVAPIEARTQAVESIPVIGLRRKIAERMQDTKRRIPHFSYVEEIDVTDLEALRAALNARWSETHGRLTLLPLLLRALVLAIDIHPEVNARFDDEAGVVHRHHAVHAGIATQTPSGLVVPVLRDVGSSDPWQLAAEISRLADLARTGKAARDDLQGSTITVTSLGTLGGIVTTPVINSPEVAIVGVNRIVERPVVRAGAVVVRSMMNLSSSFDHRVVDGMVAARFVQAIRAVLETPALLFAPTPGGPNG